jgi:hypothetical protein
MHGACFVWSSVSRSLLLAAAGEIPTLVDEGNSGPCEQAVYGEAASSGTQGATSPHAEMATGTHGRFRGAAIMTQRAARSAPDPAGHVWGALRAQSCYVLSPSP